MFTFRKILVANDLEQAGKDALALGRELARSTGAELLVTNVLPLEAVPYGVGGQGVAARASGTHGLYEFAEEVDADLIVVGSSSRSLLKHELVEGVGLALLHGAPCAIAVAPRGYHTRAGALRRITAAYDTSPESEHALGGAFDLAADAQAALTIVGVAPPMHCGTGSDGREAPDPITLAVERRLHERLEAARSRAPRGVAVEASLLQGDPASVLLDAAASSDLLVLGSRRFGPRERALLGSTSSEIVHSTRVPVLVFPRGIAEFHDDKKPVQAGVGGMV